MEKYLNNKNQILYLGIRCDYGWYASEKNQ